MVEYAKNLHRLDGKLVWEGFVQLLPIAVFVSAFGAAFGLAGAQAGLSDSIIVVMSTLVFAGAAQFAALDLWGAQIPLLPLIITVFAINARHLLMGAALYPWLRCLPPSKRYGVMLVASDANWAMAMHEFDRGKPGLGVLLGGGLALWTFWIIGAWIGAYFGNVVSDPKQFGLDMVMGCFLLAVVLAGQVDSRVLAIWALAALSSLLAYWYLPANSHVIVGALVGGAAGLLLDEGAGDDH